jgi:hypothetical protein
MAWGIPLSQCEDLCRLTIIELGYVDLEPCYRGNATRKRGRSTWAQHVITVIDWSFRHPLVFGLSATQVFLDLPENKKKKKNAI